MKLALIFNKEREDTIGCYFEKAAERMGIDFSHFWTSDEEIPAGYDLYLRIDHGDYKYDIPEHVRPSAFYAIDTHLEKPYKKIREQARHYDHIFCAQLSGAKQIKRDTGKDAVWVPIGCDPERHRDLALTRRFDIGFVGTEGKKNPRGELLRSLAKRYPDSFIGRADSGLMANIYSSSKIGFNYSINNDINMRMFEVMSCGALLLTNRIRGNGFEELFADGKNVVVYSDPGDLMRKADYHISHDEESAKIASAGRALAVSKYPYKDRLARMLEECGWR